jgi:hypothetical protein
VVFHVSAATDSRVLSSFAIYLGEAPKTAVQVAWFVLHYVVETYQSRVRPEVFEVAAMHARRAAEEVSGEGLDVRHVRSVFVAVDETCFHFFEATSIEAVRHACERGGITTDRIALSLVSESADSPKARSEDAHARGWRARM